MIRAGGVHVVHTPAGLRTFEPAPAEGRCRYVGCDRRATHAHRSKYARRWWLGCGQHQAAMSTALYIGQPSDSSSVTTIRLGAS